MNINWKLRFQNKATLTALIVQGITLVYAVLALFGIAPGVGADAVSNVLFLLVELLCLLGIVIDPTTEGVGDSGQAMGYPEPRK